MPSLTSFWSNILEFLATHQYTLVDWPENIVAPGSPSFEVTRSIDSTTARAWYEEWKKPSDDSPTVVPHFKRWSHRKLRCSPCPSLRAHFKHRSTRTGGGRARVLDYTPHHSLYSPFRRSQGAPHHSRLSAPRRLRFKALGNEGRQRTRRSLPPSPRAC